MRSTQGRKSVAAGNTARTQIDESLHFSSRVGPSIAGCYAAFAVFFAYLRVWPLVAVYLVCLLFDFSIRRVTRLYPYRINRLLPWVWVVVFLQALFAVWLVGANAGFQYYLLATIPPGFAPVARPMRTKLLQAAFIVFFFLVCDSWWVRDATPLYPFPESFVGVLRLVNTILTCAMLAGGVHVQSLVIKESADILQRIAGTDALTGLLNRRSFGEVAERELALSRRNGRALSMVLGDIDFFKRINDEHGHAAGDHVLQVVANLLQAALREYDCIARWGGEEFAILLPDTDLNHARTIAERLRVSVYGSHPQYEGLSIPVSMTLGIAQYSAEENWQAIVARADEALYRGKSGGRNRVEIG